MTKKQIVDIICRDEAIMTGLGKTLVFDIASRICKLSIKETRGYTDMLRKVSKIMAAGCDNCVIGWPGLNKCPDNVYQRRGEIDGPCEKLIYQYLKGAKL